MTSEKDIEYVDQSFTPVELEDWDETIRRPRTRERMKYLQQEQDDE